MTEPEDSEDLDNVLVDRCVSHLMEHFDTVQIFVTKQVEGSASPNHPRGCMMSTFSGAGNCYARMGQVWEWLEIQKQMAKKHPSLLDKDEDE